jgi:hypothetical protein
MVPSELFSDATRRMPSAQLAGDRLPFLGAQLLSSTHQSSPQKIPRKGGTLAESKSARIIACRYDRLSPRGVRSRVAMRSRCSGVSGGNESTMVRMCSANTVAARSIAGSVMLGGGASAVGAGCVREGGGGPGGSVVSISGAAVVGCTCLTLLRVLLVLSRCFEWFGLPVRCVFLSFRGNHGGLARFDFGLRLRSRNRRTADDESVGFGCRVGAGFAGRSFDGCADVGCEVAAYPSHAAVLGGHVLASRSATQLSYLPSEQVWFYEAYAKPLENMIKN